MAESGRDQSRCVERQYATAVQPVSLQWDAITWKVEVPFSARCSNSMWFKALSIVFCSKPAYAFSTIEYKDLDSSHRNWEGFQRQPCFEVSVKIGENWVCSPDGT